MQELHECNVAFESAKMSLFQPRRLVRSGMSAKGSDHQRLL